MNFEILSNFHFMRPLWLLGVFFLPLIWFALERFNFTSGDWEKSIDSKLLQHLTPAGHYEGSKKNSWLPVLIILCALVSLSGPSWHKKPLPVTELQDDMVIVLDLSISMLATDVSPSRLVRAKQKIQDLLDLRQEGNTSLIVFSGDSHIVTPLTDDVNTISSSLAAIDPFIMPVIGSRPDLAIKQAVQLFKQNNSRSGRIILFSDGVSGPQIDRITATLSERDVSLNVIAVGTKEGAPIEIPGQGYFKSQGEIVIPSTDFDSLNKLATDNRGAMTGLSLDDSDLLRFDISGAELRKRKALNDELEKERFFDTWEDSGYLLLVILVPLALFAYRQNAILMILFSSSLVFYSEPNYAFEIADLFKTQDQKAQVLMKQHKYEEAAKTFESAEHRAAAEYRAGNFEAAQKIYSTIESESALYNQANSLAKTQKFEEALNLYEKVLELNPMHEDARFNKELIEKLQKQNESQSDNEQDSQNQNNNQDNKQDGESQNDSQNSDGSQGQENSRQSEESNSQNNDNNRQNQSSDSKNEQEDKSSNPTENNDTEEPDPDEQQQAAALDNSENDDENDDSEPENAISSSLKELNDEEKQSYEQWMRRVPDDPSGLLRRKFEQQSYERRRKGGVDTLNEGEPVW